jgi:hypothetical protein
MTVTERKDPWPEDHPLRQRFVAFGLRPPQATSGDTQSANSAETEDDPEGIQMEILRRARARLMAANAVMRVESAQGPQAPADESGRTPDAKNVSGDSSAS